MKLLSIIRKFFFSRITVGVIGISIQFIYLIMLFWTLGTMFSYSYFIFIIAGIATALYIINQELNPSYKLVWVLVVLSLPIFGCMFYFFYGQRNKRSTPLSQDDKVRSYNDEKVFNELISEYPAAAKQAYYLRRYGRSSVYKNTFTHYYPNGESAFPDILSRLRSADSSIYLEYFIIQSGLMWDSILDILKEKAAVGIDVRIIYDELGCIMTLPSSFKQDMKHYSIKCITFEPIRPLWSGRLNNRDHRKLLIIDGAYCFTGGINLADEYINQYPKHGYWKDSVLFICGSSVDSFSLTYAKMWEQITGEQFEPLYPASQKNSHENGYVIPYCDSPDDNEMIGENVYLNIINSAEKYVYISTPYLIIDNEMMSALILASKNGIDVKIITPHIADKKIVHAVTRANYQRLLEHGVKIYEFTDGFIHAKNFVSDDKIAVAGTINLDFRSLYLHYECAVWMYNTDAVQEMKQDFTATLDSCVEITPDTFKERDPLRRSLMALLRLFSPMM